MIERYPNYGQWIALMAQRDQGIMMVLIVAAVAVFLLFQVRAAWQVALPATRFVIALTFGFMLASALAGALIGVKP